MATPDVRNVLKVPGYLVKNPTDLSAAFPHGGTALGLVRGIELRIVPRAREVTAEEWGGQRVATVYCGETAILAAVLRTWDAAMFPSVFPNASSTTIDMKVASPSVAPGTVLTPFKLLFSPVALTYHPFVYFREATGLPDAAAKLQLSLKDELGTAVVFRAQASTTGGSVYQVGGRSAITL